VQSGVAVAVGEGEREVGHCRENAIFFCQTMKFHKFPLLYDWFSLHA
jgi:hypothetical protein